MTAHKRRHTTQPFALCKLSYTASETTEHVPDIASDTPLSSLLPSQPQKAVRTNEESNKHDIALMCFIKYYSSAMVLP